MYISDWLPTLLSAAGLRSQVTLPQIDGVDMWPSISGEVDQSPRAEVLVNIDPLFNYSAIRRGDFKYVLGSVDNGDEWYGETGREEDKQVEGDNPKYDPENVLMSKTGTAISGLLTARQVRWFFFSQFSRQIRLINSSCILFETNFMHGSRDVEFWELWIWLK